MSATNSPSISSDFFDSLIDDFGIWQHTDGHTPHGIHGYALDDAARGLVACLALGKLDQAEVLFSYLLQSRTRTEFYGFARMDHSFFANPASDDAKAQVVWAYGHALAYDFRAPEAASELAIIQPTIAAMPSLRGPAYALLGASYYDRDWASALAAQVAGRFTDLQADWFWPESRMTYALGILPYCLLRYEIVTHDSQYHELARRILAFVEHVSTNDRPLGPVGNDGWYHKGVLVAPNYSQQPIDAAYMIWAHMAAYQLSFDRRDLDRARRWMAWFDGDNIAGIRLWNPLNNQCYDGIDPFGINTDSGAETNICYLLSRWAIATQTTF